MSYKINFSLLSESFVIPSVIADNYIKMANEVQIKTILWIFRNSGESIDASQIAKKIGKSTSAVEEALLYWSSVGVLQNDVLPESVKAAPPVTAVEKKELPDIPIFAPSYEQIVKRCSESPELEEFFNEIQKILGKTLGYDGQSAFVMMHDSYGLPFEVIFMLVSFCVETGKHSFQYMSKMAQSWGEKEIDTIEKADKAISDIKTCSKVWREFTRFTGIQTPKPTSTQETFLLKWTNDYKFNVEMIYLAYEIMADNCTRVNFRYMDAVLKAWFEKGIMTPEQAESSREEWKKSRPAKKNKGQDFTSTSYDMDKFKKRADELPVYKPREGSQK
ncbi:MAG: DnaD domain protein [Clostridia bacterium]|nr:DnaD domain protein [Clostridia bacterium]